MLNQSWPLSAEIAALSIPTPEATRANIAVALAASRSCSAFSHRSKRLWRGPLLEPRLERLLAALQALWLAE